MNDRELLEAAAKAYWVNEIDDVVAIEWGEADNSILYTHADNQDYNGQDVTLCWNPLVNDDDALKLAVRLKLWVCPSQAFVAIIRDGRSLSSEKMQSNPYAATRRAIVRAAAALGPDAALALTAAQQEIAMLRAQVADAKLNTQAYERIVGRKTYQEVAEEIATLKQQLSLTTERKP